jgi:hypothetical protein
LVAAVNDAKTAEDKKIWRNMAVLKMKAESLVTLEVAVAEVKPLIIDALGLFKSLELPEGIKFGAHSMKFTHTGQLAAVGEITTNIVGRTDSHQKGRLVDKNKAAWDWLDEDKGALLECLKQLTPTLMEGKCDTYHHPNGTCAIAVVYNRPPFAHQSAFHESSMAEKAAILTTRAAAADSTQVLEVAANFQPGGGGRYPDDVTTCGGGTAVLFGRLAHVGHGGHSAASRFAPKRDAPYRNPEDAAMATLQRASKRMMV